MTEGLKTTIFVGLALLVAVLAAISYPRAERKSTKPEEQATAVLFPEFDNPSKASSIEVTRYNQDLGELSTFQVARDPATGAWTIPSHEGYPADAETRMKDAALMLVDLRSLGVATDVKGEHKEFGVVEPNKEKVQVGDKGVGLLVKFLDSQGQNLAALVIGSKVKGQDNQRFVRIAGQDRVHVVKIDPDKLSTKFEDWIEKKLLKLSSWDIENVEIKSYSASPSLDPATGRVGLNLDRKFNFTAEFKDNEWKLKDLTKFSGRDEAKATLAANEELNKDKLNDFKTALDDMSIADVRRKPAGMGTDLRAGEDFLKDRSSVEDLFKRGFYAVSSREKGGTELLNANGEVSIGMKDGVQYMLRFGESVGGGGSESDGQNRYLLVTTRVDMTKFPPPQLEALPELPGKKDAAKPDAAKPAAAKTAPEKPAAKPADAKVEVKPSDTKPADSKPAGAKPAEVKASPSGNEDSKPGAPKAEAAKPETKPAAQPAKEEKKPATKPAPGEKQPDAAPAPKDDREAKEAEIERERERINKENQRKIDERKEKLEKAEQKVAELNTRFANWYYVVAEKEYKRIQLDIADLIKQKEADKSKPGEDAADPQDFNKLKQEGLKKEAPKPAAKTEPAKP